MKKLILSVLAVIGAGAMMPTEADAQMYIIKDGKVKVALDYTPDYITFENPMLCGGVVGEAVDMGLSVKWSSVNVGASNPHDAGNYYAWGETEAKSDYSWSTYAHMKSGYSDWNGVNKYQAADNQRGGRWYDYDNNKKFIGDNKTVLEVADDAAAANWQGGWVMPTQADWKELANSCYLVWTNTYNSKSVNGWIVYKAKNDADKGKKVYSGSTPSSDYDVSSDAHIFLPAAGYRDGSFLGNEGSYGYYWSSSLYENSSSYGRYVSFYSGDFYASYYNDRCYGQSVRPVCPAQGITNGHDAVELGLPSGKLWATCNVGASAPEGSGSYFAWGETEVKSDYSWSTYKHMHANGTNWQDINKYTANDGQNTETVWYNNNTGVFTGDNKSVLETSDDVATQSWGEEWRMPTIDEWQELYNNTTQEWTDDYNGTGVKGYILTSTKEGHTDASIFLPAAGYRFGGGLFYEGSYGYYWSSSLHEYYSDYGRGVYFDSGYFSTGSSYSRCNGQSVRPVCPAQK